MFGLWMKSNIVYMELNALLVELQDITGVKICQTR